MPAAFRPHIANPSRHPARIIPRALRRRWAIGPVVLAGALMMGSVAAPVLATPSNRAIPPQITSPALQPPESASADSSSEMPINLRPYRIRAWISFDPALRFGLAQRRRLLDDWMSQIDRFIGSPWQVVVDPDPGPLAGYDDLATLDPARLVWFAHPASPESDVAAKAASADGPPPVEPQPTPPLWSQAAVWALADSAQRHDRFDKIWVMRAAPLGAGLGIEARELDLATGRFGPVFRRSCLQMPDAARALMNASVAIFAPFAQVKRQRGGSALLTIQAAGITPASPLGRFVTRGTPFQPFRVFLNPDKSIKQIQEIPYSYLNVEQVDFTGATAKSVSAFVDPLSGRSRTRLSFVGLGVKANDQPTPIQFVDRQSGQPLAGYKLQALDIQRGITQPVGQSRRDGIVPISPRLFPGLWRFQLVAGEVEPLAEFVLIPGETQNLRTLKVDPKLEAMEVHARLNRMTDRIVDLVAQRNRLKTLMDLRLAEDRYDETQALLEELAQLPSPKTFRDELAQLKAECLERQNQENKKPPTQRRTILTRMVQKRFIDVQGLIDSHLSDAPFEELAEQLQDQRREAQRKADVKKRRG